MVTNLHSPLSFDECVRRLEAVAAKETFFAALSSEGQIFMSRRGYRLRLWVAHPPVRNSLRRFLTIRCSPVVTGTSLEIQTGMHPLAGIVTALWLIGVGTVVLVSLTQSQTAPSAWSFLALLIPVLAFAQVKHRLRIGKPYMDALLELVKTQLEAQAAPAAA